MTDLQQHLKGIHKILAQRLDAAASGAVWDWSQIRAALRDFLPRSYGIGAGCIRDEKTVSEPVTLLLYDVPLSDGVYDEAATVFQAEHVLCVLEAAVSYDVSSLKAALQRIASVKSLETGRTIQPRPQDRPPGQQRDIIPKDRLPYCLLVANTFATYTPENARLYTHLHELLNQQTLWQHPDDIRLMGQQVRYRNPLLDDLTVPAYAINLSRTPQRIKPGICYVCNRKFFRQHFHYERLCMECADLNYMKRTQQVDLSGHRVLVTGGRVKIGYATALRLLRNGAEVIVTSRFPRDAARRYTSEPDFAAWQENLHIYGLDMRDIRQVEWFIDRLITDFAYLDALINNAAQTIKRPVAYYHHLIPLETAPAEQLPAAYQPLLKTETFPFVSPSSNVLPITGRQSPDFSALSVPDDRDAAFPAGEQDEHGQQIDNRPVNSWILSLDEISAQEMLEVHLVNAVVPALLAGQLKPLLKQSPREQRFVINVSAAEGRFSQRKNGYHPHTNMAKAALNMMTRTIARDYARQQIVVVSVDPGWVSDQVPRTHDDSRAVAADRLPIDMVDAAARICDPLFASHTGETISAGRLYKDYAVVSW